jgi:hypothetical protein
MAKAQSRKRVSVVSIRWLPQPQEHDYPAALSYLTLAHPEKSAREVVKTLKQAPMSSFAAKDILRASGLSQGGVSNSHVEKDRARIREGTPLSPILLVRDPALGRVIVADGYHRLCAAYSVDEDVLIPCKIV